VSINKLKEALKGSMPNECATPRLLPILNMAVWRIKLL